MLKELEEEAVLPLAGGAHEMDEVYPGLRMPPQTVEQAQLLIQSALVRGMQLAHECKQPWCVLNGAIYAWNIFLPCIVQRRCATLYSLLSG
jgi:hypothetical protein